jgi:hypothetical protein
MFKYMFYVISSTETDELNIDSLKVLFFITFFPP